MSLMGLLGLALTVISVLAAYQVGHRAGLQEGRHQGFEDGKKAGAKEGSMRGYAVGYDRGRRAQDGTEQATPKKNKSMPPLLILIAIVGAIWILASISIRQPPQDPGHALPSEIDAWTSETNPRQP